MKITTLGQTSVIPTMHGTGKKKVLVPTHTVPHLNTFSQVEFAPGEQVEEHAHPDMTEVFLIEDGEALIIVEGKEYQVKKGTCVLVSPKEKHSVVSNGTVPLVMTYFGIFENS